VDHIFHSFFFHGGPLSPPGLTLASADGPAALLLFPSLSAARVVGLCPSQLGGAQLPSKVQLAFSRCHSAHLSESFWLRSFLGRRDEGPQFVLSFLLFSPSPASTNGWDFPPSPAGNLPRIRSFTLNSLTSSPLSWFLPVPAEDDFFLLLQEGGTLRKGAHFPQ